MDMTLSDTQYQSLTAQSANYRTILRLLQAGGLNSYLRDRRLPPIDLELTPDDVTGGNSINMFIKSISDECNRMDKKITSLSEALVDTSIELAKEKRKKSLRKSLTDYIKNALFFFKK